MHDGIAEWRWGIVRETKLLSKLENAQTAVGSCTRLITDLQERFGTPVMAIIGPIVKTRRQKDKLLNGRVYPTGWTRFGLVLASDGIPIL